MVPFKLLVLLVGALLGISSALDDGCKPLSWFSSSPACPQTVGPPCPRCYTNPYLENKSVDSIQTTLSSVKSKLPGLMSSYESIFPHAEEIEGKTVFSGASGYALVYLKLFRKTGDSRHLSTAGKYVETSLQDIDLEILEDLEEGLTGFQWSHTGVASVAAAYYSALGDMSSCSKYAEIVVKKARENSSKFADIDSGDSGLLGSLAFLRANTKCLGETFSVSMSLAVSILERGVVGDSLVLSWTNPMDDDRWLGTSHGTAGILFEVLHVDGILESTHWRPFLIATLEDLIAHQFDSGNFPSQYFKDDQDELVQWDHGAPGVSMTLFKAGEITGHDIELFDLSQSLFAAAARAQECVWRRGLLTKGLMLCHGISGNVYSMLYAYKATKDPVYLHRALLFTEFVVSNELLSDTQTMRKVEAPMNPNALWSGHFAGTFMLWTDILHGVSGSNASVAMTGFEHDF